MNIAFYIENSKISNLDFSNIIDGNPGIGGTEYLILLISTLLSVRDNKINVFLYAQINNNLPKGPEIKIVKNIEDAILDADRIGINKFVINLRSLNWFEFDYKKLSSEMTLIPWCHNFANLNELSFFAKNRKISRVLNVGKEQFDLYRDMDVFKKSDYIYNCVTFPPSISDFQSLSSLNCRKHIITYVGSLIPTKSLHVLAAMWPKIKKAVPDAELYIIGSGKLYNKRTKLGSYNIAEESYEKKFIPFFLDDRGQVHKDVHFMGELGLEKFDILKKSKVGVPNPSGKSETFCLSAVEMQAAGCFVCALSAPGYYDTFVNGKIANSKSKLCNLIISALLSDFSQDLSSFIKYYNNNFAIQCVIQDWENFLLSKDCEYLHPITPIKHPFYRLKFLKEILRVIKKFKFFRFFPPIERIYDIFFRINRRITKYII